MLYVSMRQYWMDGFTFRLREGAKLWVGLLLLIMLPPSQLSESSSKTVASCNLLSGPSMIGQSRGTANFSMLSLLSNLQMLLLKDMTCLVNVFSKSLLDMPRLY